jgi:hypothetical protein
VHFSGPLQLHEKWTIGTGAKIDGSRDSLRVHGFDSGYSSARCQNLGNDFVGGLRCRVHRKKQNNSEAKWFDFHDPR